jgi:DTW domain-containing protein YfiP
MGRSVVLAGAARCPRCSLPPRWCTCNAFPVVQTHLAVHVLIHQHEQRKPSSTGNLIARSVAGAACHGYQRLSRHFPASSLPAEAVDSTRELWVLHPSGEPMPMASSVADGSRGVGIQLLLIDGTWRQAGEMLASVHGRGRCVRLSNAATSEPSRYWLRNQARPEQLCTAEALMGVFTAVGEPEAERRLRLHFELHVYATLRARGHRELAERYLGHSPLLTDAADALDGLHARRVS